MTNLGQISGGLRSAGVWLDNGGVVRNEGQIKGDLYSTGVVIDHAQGAVVNSGTISGGFFYGTGVALGAGGSVTNEKGGKILGGSGPGYVEGIGIGISGSGTVANLEGASIEGGVSISGIGRVLNAGVIGGTIRGVALGGGSLSNAATGKISADRGPAVQLHASGAVTNHGAIGVNTPWAVTEIGVEISGGSGVVTNAGAISGSLDSVLFDAGTTNNRLVIDPGAVFNGVVDATAATNSTLELAKGGAVISGIGTSEYLGFDTLVVDDRAAWTVTGANTISTLLNNGQVEVSGEGLSISTAIDPHSKGSFKLDNGSALEIAAALGSDTEIFFNPGSDLVIDNYALFGKDVGTRHYAGSLLEDFGGSTVDLKGFGIAGLQSSFSDHTGLLQLSNGAAQLATLDFQASTLGVGAFHFASDGGNGVLVSHS